ncbi:hypothetical protein EDD35_2277 [Amycolatopsis thermoflava]|uniref:Uncharacterized protein n=1 Tax=Amycolatopsis thermoflava TaxID=84480 RepID=A0A3N2GTI1_9PSEU|nr:hypothetical protein EDD35_2277 [Amycolatopsis thermoflava]
MHHRSGPDQVRGLDELSEVHRRDVGSDALDRDLPGERGVGNSLGSGVGAAYRRSHSAPCQLGSRLLEFDLLLCSWGLASGRSLRAFQVRPSDAFRVHPHDCCPGSSLGHLEQLRNGVDENERAAAAAGQLGREGCAHPAGSTTCVDDHRLHAEAADQAGGDSRVGHRMKFIGAAQRRYPLGPVDVIVRVCGHTGHSTPAFGRSPPFRVRSEVIDAEWSACSGDWMRRTSSRHWAVIEMDAQRRPARWCSRAFLETPPGPGADGRDEPLRAESAIG